MGLLGINAKLYYRSAGSYASPTFTENSLISDLSQSVAWDEADADARESRVHQKLKSMLGLEWTGKMKKKHGDSTYLAFMDALLSDGTLDLLILDGDKDIEGSDGWRIEGQVFSGTEDQGMGNALYIDIKIVPFVGDNPPLAVRVGAGPALTYATPGVDGSTFA